MSAQPPEIPPAEPPPTAARPPIARTRRKNQGIPYQLRRIQMMDAVILSAILAVFAVTYDTKEEVRTMRAEHDAQEKVDAEDPPIRRVRYEWEVGAVRKHIEAVDGRVTELEEEKPE